MELPFQPEEDAKSAGFRALRGFDARYLAGGIQHGPQRW
jgi:hypothetical protein